MMGFGYTIPKHAAWYMLIPRYKHGKRYLRHTPIRKDVFMKNTPRRVKRNKKCL